MGAKVNFDAANKLIIVTSAPVLENGDWVIDIDVKIDIYSDGKEDWLASSFLMGFEFPVRSVGGDPLPGSKELGATFFIASDWKIRSYEADHILRLNGNVYSEDGTSPFVATVGTYNVTIINTVSSLVDSTVQQLAEIEYAAFNGGITFDAINGYEGTGRAPNGHNIGTPPAPVKLIADAKTIAEDRGFSTGYVIGDLTFDLVTSVIGFTFIGSSKDRSTFTMPDAAIVQDCSFREATLTGVLDGQSKLVDCVVEDLAYINGFIESCVLSGTGTITLGGGGTSHFLSCYSGVPGTATPTIDLGGSGQALAMRDYNGGILLTNKIGTEAVSIDLSSGQVKLDLDGNFGDAGVTNGTIVIRGSGKVIDATSGDYLPSGTYGSLTLLNETVGPDSFSASKYGGRVYIEVGSGFSGKVAPFGLITHPVETIDDAQLIVATYNLIEYHFHSDYTILSGTDLSGYILSSHNKLLTFTSGAITDGVIINHAGVTGTLSGANHEFNDCKLSNLSGVTGDIHNSELGGTISFSGDTLLFGCIVPPTAPVILEINGYNSNIDNIQGFITIKNITGGAVNVGLRAGILTIDPSCTAGTIYIDNVGNGEVIDNNNGSSVTIKEFTKESVSDSIWDEDLTEHTIVDSAGDALGNISASVDVSAIADAVWDEDLTGHIIVDSAGDALGNVSASVDVDAIADAVWDEQTIGHDTVGSFGEKLDNLNVDVDNASIADAVWDEVRAGHVIPGTFGSSLGVIDLTDGEAIADDVWTSVTGANIHTNILGIREDTEEIQVDTDAIIIGVAANGPLDYDAMADAVWDEDFTTHQTIDTYGFDVIKKQYNNVIYIDVNTGSAGTSHPRGLLGSPVNNIPDAVILAIKYCCHFLHIHSNVIVPNGTDVSYYHFQGHQGSGNTITLESGCITNITEFESVRLVGYLNGRTSIHDAFIEDLYNLQGKVTNCRAGGTIGMWDDITNQVVMTGCHSKEKTPTIFDIGDAAINNVDWTGMLSLDNKTGNNDTNIHLKYGFVDVTLNCIAGDIFFVGNGVIDDNSQPGCNVNTDNIFNSDTISVAVWDEPLTGLTHNLPTSAGRQIRALASLIIFEGDVQSSTANTVVLDIDASDQDGAYDPAAIAITEGAGAGQSRLILEYKGSTRTAIIDRDWKVQPDVTSTYVISTDPGREHVNEGLVRGATTNTVTLNEHASSIDDIYNGQVILLRSGTGQDQACKVIAYNGTTKIATMCLPWSVVPDITTGYVMLPTAYFHVPQLALSLMNYGMASEASVIAGNDEVEIH